MIIDVHVHLTVPGFVRGKFVRQNAQAGAAVYNKVHNANLDISGYMDMLKGTVDPDGSKLIANMDKAGIDKAVIFGVDWAYGFTGEPRVSNREQNKIHADMAKKWEGRFIALAALDPRRPDLMDQAKQCIEEWGMRGFKIMPAAGFYPIDPICFPLYEKCADWKVPILFHSGGGEAQWQYSQPMYIASAAHTYPEVKMVMAHAGGESWLAARQAAMMMPNVFLDLSVRQMDYLINRNSFYRWLRDMIDWSGPWKIMFATDTPMPNFWLPMDEWVKAIKEPQTTEVKFTSEEIDLVMGKAAEAVFDLS